jgi:hypothetical protein
MSTPLYIVVRKNGAERTICSDGPKPFIGSLQKAKDVANFLKSVNPSENYVVMAVGSDKHVGVVTDRYSATEETANAPKRTRKTSQKRS